MGRKRRGHPDIEDVLTRPWCYYCERDFEDLKLLISHQKAKHFKCDRCGRRLNTAGGLSVHMNQVHKEALTLVENALPNRQNLDVEIFGMEGIPQDALDQHRNRIIQNFYQAQEDRRLATGNPLPGQAMKRKKITYETGDEILKRLAEFRATRKNAPASGAMEGVVPTNPQPTNYVCASSPSHASIANPCQPQNPPFQQPQTNLNQPGFAGQPPFGYSADSLPARPSSGTPTAANLPQRPGQPGAAGGDDIDQLIRMAEAGIKPGKKDEDDATAEKKAKKDKDKKGRMVYDDTDTSPEERMAALRRYAFSLGA
ncbi:hypothetical protein S40288_02304 [Stachybotrys chartarum IBT 40288]|nr:hypothetical protein S40288_02304 [Stachybotrys chartarum IBT 40288]